MARKKRESLKRKLKMWDCSERLSKREFAIMTQMENARFKKEKEAGEAARKKALGAPVKGLVIVKPK